MASRFRRVLGALQLFSVLCFLVPFFVQSTGTTEPLPAPGEVEAVFLLAGMLLIVWSLLGIGNGLLLLLRGKPSRYGSLAFGFLLGFVLWEVLSTRDYSLGAIRVSTFAGIVGVLWLLSCFISSLCDVLCPPWKKVAPEAIPA